MKKINIPYQITYLLFILFFTAGAIFYRQSFLAILLILVCILPIISIYATITLSKHIRFTTKPKTGSITVGNNIVIGASINNPTIIPFLNCEVSFTLQNLFYENNLVHRLSLSAPAKNNQEIDIPILTRYSGISELNFKNMEITDFLHLYTVSIELNQIHQIPVMPELKKINYPLFDNLTETDDDEDFLNNVGQQSYDIKELREFRPGDRQNLIHWKMSSKTDDILVKDMERMASRILLIIPEYDRLKLEMTMTTLWSYINFLLDHNEIFKIGIFNHVNKEFNFKIITNKDEGLECLLACMFMPSYVSTALALRTFKEIYGDDKQVISLVADTIKES